MKVNANTLRAGHVIEHNGKLWVIAKSEIMTPGKGASVVQVVMRDARTGIKANERFRTQEVVERAQMEEHDMQFLFSDGDHFTFMNQENFEQLTVDRDVIGDPAAFLQEGMICTVKTHEGSPLAVTLPDTVIMEIVEADPVVRGQTASSSYKPARLENGARVMVPPHIEVGTKIVVNTADSSYLERAK